MSESFWEKSNQATLLMIFANNKKSFEQQKTLKQQKKNKKQQKKLKGNISWTRNDFTELMRKLNQRIFFQTFAPPIVHSYGLIERTGRIQLTLNF